MRVRVCECVSELPMSDGPPQKDGFAILMSNATPVCRPNDPWYTAVIYEAWLEHVDESEPLWRVPYFGQVVRADSADENFKARKYEHETDTISKPKDLGFHAVIGMFGADKIAWRVLSSKPGRRSEVQAWANAEEIRLIDAHGGVLRDMDAKLQQTLNLTKGGKGDPAAVWAGIEAKRHRALTKFKAAMEAYVAEHGSSLVPQAYVDEDGYRLGIRLNGFRRGQMRKGMSDQADIDAWAEALPKWAWNAKETDEWREEKGRAVKDRRANATEEERAEWSKTSKEVQKRPEVHAKKVQATTDWFANSTEEQKAEWKKAQLDGIATKRRAELERARLIAVPFVNNRKRRAKMRAASAHTKPYGRGDNVLYMISEDGKTIRRVNKDGHMRERDIVGPVVDPAPSDAYVSESD